MTQVSPMSDQRIQELMSAVWKKVFDHLKVQSDICVPDAGEIATAAAIAATNELREFYVVLHLQQFHAAGFKRDAQWIPGIFPVPVITSNKGE